MSKKAIGRGVDSEADVLYISFEATRPAVGVDMGNSVIMRYDEEQDKIVGITIIGARTSARHRRESTGYTEKIATTKPPGRNCLISRDQRRGKPRLSQEECFRLRDCAQFHVGSGAEPNPAVSKTR